MSFLNDLLTLKYATNIGRELSSRKPTMKERLFGEQIPCLYRAHQTEAGLFVVLPYNSNKSLFSFQEDEGHHLKEWEYENHFAGFNLWITNILKEKGKETNFQSMIGKMTYHGSIASGVRTRLTYTAQKGELVSLKLGYGLLLQSDLVGTVQFDVNKKSNGEVEVDLPVVDTWKPLILDSGKYINYDKTLKNLVELMLKPKMSEEDVFAVFNYDYVEENSWLH